MHAYTAEAQFACKTLLFSVTLMVLTDLWSFNEASTCQCKAAQQLFRSTKVEASLSVSPSWDEQCWRSCWRSCWQRGVWLHIHVLNWNTNESFCSLSGSFHASPTKDRTISVFSLMYDSFPLKNTGGRGFPSANNSTLPYQCRTFVRALGVQFLQRYSTSIPSLVSRTQTHKHTLTACLAIPLDLPAEDDCQARPEISCTLQLLLLITVTANPHRETRCLGIVGGFNCLQNNWCRRKLFKMKLQHRVTLDINGVIILVVLLILSLFVILLILCQHPYCISFFHSASWT